jgi:undecaprenyl-diphosphatase
MTDRIIVNPYLIAVIVGIIEGLTEFLPVSSTAHIRIAQAILKIDLNDGFWKMFAVAIQLPAILAVVIYFRRQLLEFVASWFRGKISPEKFYAHPLALVGIATVVTGVPAALLSDSIKENLASLVIMGWALLVGGIVMWVVDVIYGKKGRIDSVDRIVPWQAAWIGAVQILSAVFPGVSRSMSTIAAGQIAGLTRKTALEFSFYVSIPIMLAACLFDLKKSLAASPGTPAYISGGMNLERWITLGIGGLTSFISAYLVIAWFMAWVKKRGFVPFAVYRMILGVIVLWWAYQSG